jgi:hypothetical protein
MGTRVELGPGVACAALLPFRTGPMGMVWPCPKRNFGASLPEFDVKARIELLAAGLASFTWGKILTIPKYEVGLAGCALLPPNRAIRSRI